MSKSNPIKTVIYMMLLIIGIVIGLRFLTVLVSKIAEMFAERIL